MWSMCKRVKYKIEHNLLFKARTNMLSPIRQIVFRYMYINI